MPADAAWIADLKLAMSSREPDAPWRIMRIKEDSWCALGDVSMRYCALVDAQPSGADRATVSKIVVGSIKNKDYELLIMGLAALNRLSARRPLDAPPRTKGPEHEVAQVARAALEDAPSEYRGYLQINLANALRAMGTEYDEAAQEAYAQAIEAEPERGGWHLDLAVLHKWRGRWQAAFDSALRARSRMGDERPVLWNFALAATALGEGDLAAGAWRDLGIEHVEIGAGGLPLVRDVPPRRVRVRSKPSGYGMIARDAGFEVLSVAPISPGHGVVASASFEDSPVDFGDIVLWDGAPVAVDENGPIFPTLEVLRRGDELRHRFVAIVEDGDVEALREEMGDGVRIFVHNADPVAKQGEERLVYGKLVATAAVGNAALRARLEQYGARVRTLRIAMPGLYESLGDTRRAGQEHQAWRGVERAAIKRGIAPSKA